MYATFIQFEHFHLSKSGAILKFVNTNCSVLTDSAFYFALPLLLCWMNFFDPLMSSSIMQCPEVLRMIVSPLNMLIFIVANPLMSCSKFGVEEVFKDQEREMIQHDQGE